MWPIPVPLHGICVSRGRKSGDDDSAAGWPDSSMSVNFQPYLGNDSHLYNSSVMGWLDEVPRANGLWVMVKGES